MAKGMKRRLFTFWLAATVLFPAALSAAGDPPLQLLYADRAPYYITQANGMVGGLVSGPVREALTKAGIAFEWVVQPGKRQIETIRKGRIRACSPGWFKKPEREKFAKFSDSIYQDRPQVVVIRRDDQTRIKHATLTGFFKDSKLRFGAKLAYSYGSYIDKWLEDISPPTQRTPQDSTGMVRMLLGRRFDYFLAAPEEFSSLVLNLDEMGQRIVSMEMTDIPPGNSRYLMCSRSVEDILMKRFNKALAVVFE